MKWEELRVRVVRGAAADLFGSVLLRALSLGRIVVVGRLFTPESYGAYSTAVLILAIPLILSEAGLRQWVVKAPEERLEAAFGTATALTLSASAILAILVAVSGPAAARILHDPTLAPLVAVMSLGVFDLALRLPLALWDREMAFGRSKLPELAGELMGIGLLLGLHAVGVRAVWVMAFAYLGTSLLRGVLFWSFAPVRPRLRVSGEEARAQIRFGLPLVASGILGFVAARGDDLAVRYFDGTAALGLYSVAFYVPALLQEIAFAVDRVSLPAFSRLDDRGTLREAFTSSVGYSAALTAPVGFGLAAFSIPLVGTVLGSRWVAAAPLLALFAVSFAVRGSTGLNWGSLAILADRTPYMAWTSAATAAFMVVVGLPLIYWLGPLGGAVYSLLQVSVMGPVVRFPLIRDVLGDLAYLRACWRPLTVSAVFAALAWGAGSQRLVGPLGLVALAGYLLLSTAATLAWDVRLRGDVLEALPAMGFRR